MNGRAVIGARSRSSAARVALVLVTALLGGCANLAPLDATAPLISGRLLVRVDADPPRSLSGEFELRGDARSGGLRLIGPLGTVAADARWSAAGSSLSTAQGRSDFASLDAMTQAALGESIPLAAMFDWLRGRPWPDAPSQPLADAAPGFAQLGWQVDLARWTDGWVQAQRQTPPRVTVRARVDQSDPR